MTDTRTKAADQQSAPKPAQPIARLAPSRLPIVGSIAKEFEIDANQWRVLVDQIFPNAKTVEAIGMAVSYCRARKLDIFKRPVHIVPMWSSVLNRMVETVWPGISEIRTTAHRTGEYAGIDAVVFGEDVTMEFEGYTGRNNETKIEKEVTFPEWASVTVYRWVKGQKAAFNALIFWEEAYASIGKTGVPNDMWEKRPRGQMMKCLEAAALRMAFPEELGNVYAAEEMEGRVIDGNVNAATAIPTEPDKPSRPTPPEPPADDEPATTIISGTSTEGGKIIEGTATKAAETATTGAETATKSADGTDVEGSNPDADESPADFLTRLDGELAVANDKATLLEIWERENPAEILDGTPFAEDADKIYARHEARVGRKELEDAGQTGFGFGDEGGQ